MSDAEETETVFEIKKFGLDPHPHPPTAESALALAETILESLPSKGWKLSKDMPEHKASVHWKTIDSELWYSRSTIQDATKYPFEWFKRALYDEIFENMVSYYEMVREATCVEEKKGWKGYRLTYLLPPPFAERDIATWLYTYTPEDREDEFTVIALPADYELQDEANTRGVYSFVHKVRKLDDDKIEWLMAQTSDMRGNLPRWVQNYSIPGVLLGDIPVILKWMEDQYGEKESQEPEETS
ncbi:hypothetical protein BZA70DRAFT_272505 [Myxozyma melibiosi]|uniref:DUF3074 domain-containing protein n=1 Tax=Myxozyma melibiosi TaxID=54550 RepID=A0ABR1FDI9_9ASCO